MILSIESSMPTFKPVRFHAGLNIMLAEKSPDSNEGHTRNSAGKTSLIEIIHFLLGGKADPDSLMRHPKLAEHTFRGTFLIGGYPITIERSGSKAARIFLYEGNFEFLGLNPKKDKSSARWWVSNEDWKTLLGHQWFELPSTLEGTAYAESYTPTYRSMFSYFARRHSSGAFIRPEKQAEAQQRWDWQVNLSYLLGLDWQIPYDLQKVRERERQLAELKKAADGGALEELIGTVAELRPAVVLAEAKAVRLRDELSRFQVLDAYRDMMDRATRIKTELQAITRRAVSLRETLAYLQESLKQERVPNRDDIGRLYNAVGIELPETARRRLNEVERFYESVIANRRTHLQSEIDIIEQELAEAEIRVAALDAERSEILRTLEGRGALEDFVALQKRYADAEAEAASLRERFKAAESLESETTQLSIDRASIKRRLQADHHARRNRLDEAILLVSDTIATLYEDRQGKFEVEATENGPEFRISIQGDRGGGIANMEIFCLDQALFTIWARREKGPGFLIHDSHMYDGVDSRQVAKAIILGKAIAEQYNGQYIVTLNSDIFDSLPLPSTLDREVVVLPTRLSDAGETGGLFGFRFD